MLLLNWYALVLGMSFAEEGMLGWDRILSMAQTGHSFPQSLWPLD